MLGAVAVEVEVEVHIGWRLPLLATVLAVAVPVQVSFFGINERNPAQE